MGNVYKAEHSGSEMRGVLKNFAKDYKGWTPLLYGGLSALTAYVGGIVTNSCSGLYRYAVIELPKISKYALDNPNTGDLLEKAFTQMYSSLSNVNTGAQISAIAGFVGGVILVGQMKKFFRHRLGGE